jgi:hypothetical protein
MPWFIETAVDPRRWNEGGTSGTWSWCISWMYCRVGGVSFVRTENERREGRTVVWKDGWDWESDIVRERKC